MTQFTISLPDTAKAYIEEQLASGSYNDADAIFADLIEQAQKRQAQQKLNAMLREGLNSGTPIEATDEWWEQKRQHLLQQTPTQL
jgi:antitoxin ParD1/3/4